MTAVCSAINAALASKGLNNAQLAGLTGLSAQRIDSILAGGAKPSASEYESIAKALNLSSKDITHATA